MRLAPLPLAACFVGFVAAGCHEVAPGVAATATASCAPWDGAATSIEVKSMGLQVHLYKDDVQAFERGATVSVEAGRGAEASVAEIVDGSSGGGRRAVSVQLSADPQLGTGQLTLDGATRPITLTWLARTATCGGARARPSASAALAPTGAPAATPPPAASSVGASDACVELREAVVKEASTLSGCNTDADCALHPVPLCDFAELDCHAAHVNKGRGTASLDGAVSAYARSCPLTKCKCAMPTKSVCSRGKCAAP